MLYTLVLDKNSYIIAGVEKSDVEKFDLLQITHPLMVTEYSVPTPEGIAKALEVRPYNPLTSENSFLIPREKFISMSKTNITGKMLYYKNKIDIDTEKCSRLIMDKNKMTPEQLKELGITKKETIVSSLNKLLKS